MRGREREDEKESYVLGPPRQSSVKKRKKEGAKERANTILSRRKIRVAVSQQRVSERASERGSVAAVPRVWRPHLSRASEVARGPRQMKRQMRKEADK